MKQIILKFFNFQTGRSKYYLDLTRPHGRRQREGVWSPWIFVHGTDIQK